jgi:hypothetical protein
VEITTGQPAEGRPSGRVISIRTSGLTFDGKASTASTDRAATFKFDQGEGEAVGVSYDPNSGELRLRSEAKVIWRGKGRDSPSMKVEAGEMLYKEHESTIVLDPWSRLTRGSLVMEGGHATVWIEDDAIQRVEAAAARGVDKPRDGRELEYAAEQLQVGFSGNNEVEKITGERNTRLVSRDKSARTTVTGDRL